MFPARFCRGVIYRALFLLRMEILKFFTKPDCPLCDETREILDEAGADWEETNILENPELWERYRNDIPVIQSMKGSWFYRNRDATPLTKWLETHG